MNPIENVAQISMRLWLTVFRGATLKWLVAAGWGRTLRGLANCNWHINHTQRGANSKHMYKFFVEIEHWSYTRSRDIIATATGGRHIATTHLCRFRQSPEWVAVSICVSIYACVCVCVTANIEYVCRQMTFTFSLSYLIKAAHAIMTFANACQTLRQHPRRVKSMNRWMNRRELRIVLWA